MIQTSDSVLERPCPTVDDVLYIGCVYDNGEKWRRDNESARVVRNIFFPISTIHTLLE